jgi:hypothetical protein
LRRRSLSWLRGAVLLGVLGVLGLGFAGVAHATPEDTRARAARLLGGSDYQRELPGEPRGAPGAAPSGNAPQGSPRHFGERHRVDRYEAEEGGGSAVASLMMWIVVAIVALLMIALVLRELVGFEAKVDIGVGGPEAASASDAATAAIVEQPLDDAEVLARAGRFGEAIHALLLRTLEELMRRLDRPLPRSRTSREILAETRLPDEARGALGHLVSAVEVSFFGGAEPGEDDYRTCVERFRRFAEVYVRGVRS